MTRSHWHITTALAIVLFIATGAYVTPSTSDTEDTVYQDRVVLSAPVQLFLYAGDRFLAANFEHIRLTSTAPISSDINTALYLGRAHLLVSKLNPCHEDNYYLGNAQLSFGGIEDTGTTLLENATECRFWDWYPPYFDGINQFFLMSDGDKAQVSLNIAADRSEKNAAALRKAAIMIATAQIRDDRVALNFLKQQHEQAQDGKLKRLLAKRVIRLEGLITLREAHALFEKNTGRTLESSKELISSGILETFPVDPLGLGYIYKDGKFQLRKLKIPDMES